ncbi:hypothetical protein F4820DRAFT_440382 [Hypoxylon rubiginosum]|uniref:Uncharacterized protein n=1 Tax=Hypoxylon rubiginosum TaxID=110542 RepID=A0ACB9YJP0_9PEZI|nr:hypothetical protein F4820DRAFT_440382 [Hypoxylon rubiginosum]
MSAIFKTAASLACLAAVVVAAPTWTDCPAGSVFYSCANGYRGCFTQDPCALPSITSPTTTTTAVPAPPTTTTVAAAACPTGTGSVKLWQPTMYNLYPSEPDRAEASVSRLEVGTAPALEQVAVFRGIPASAKSCTLGWSQADASERVFVVEKNGLLSTVPLTGFPADDTKVSAASVAAYEPKDDSAEDSTMDFTFWDQTEKATNHTGSPVACAENIYIKVALNPVNGDGHLYMYQDGKNGITLSYTC